VLLFAISISSSSLVVCVPPHFTILCHGPIPKQSHFQLLVDAILQFSMSFFRFLTMLWPDPPALHRSRSFSRFGSSFDSAQPPFAVVVLQIMTSTGRHYSPTTDGMQFPRALAAHQAYAAPLTFSL
jgi:hypothetical protein